MKRFKKFGTALLSCMMLTTSFATVSNMTMITAEAHPGRTDAQGGHHDYKNKSGLGSYHYHCGGHEAHLHPNGVCPYKNGAVSNGNTSGQTQTQTQAQSAEKSADKHVFIPFRLTFSVLFSKHIRNKNNRQKNNTAYNTSCTHKRCSRNLFHTDTLCYK